jgi:hypothetical protein
MLLPFLHLTQTLPQFGGEDPVLGNPWHHEVITREAAENVGFSEAAADELAWHADYVDSYLYNPLWWLPGGLSRLKASLASGPMLMNLHFDDLFAPIQVHTMWRRYTSGTLAGLVWAFQNNDVAAARNVVGASLHAVQDFYSHSNWLDEPARRTVTYLEMPEDERESVPLFTGSYEHPDHKGMLPHGKPGPFCVALKRASTMMDVACHPVSPLTNTTLCEVWRSCKKGTPARPETVLGIPVPANVYYLTPPGMNLDNSWQADIGVKVRGLFGVTGSEMFAAAVELARRTSEQWLSLIGTRMAETGAGAFWQRVKLDKPVKGAREMQYEDFSRFPHMFLGVGEYPPPSVRRPSREWYLRVRLVTSGAVGAGTDADIVAHAGGRRHVLDYMPRHNPLLAYNDFEAGDDQVYYIGPFTTMPSQLVLENDSADTPEVLRALGTSFVNALETGIKTVGRLLFSLIGGPADLVGHAKQVWSPNQLKALGDAPSPFALTVDGGGEGRYRVSGSIKRAGRVVQDNRAWSDWMVKLDTLLCERESDFDRGTTNDEPFVMALLLNQAPGDVLRMRTSPFGGVDKGETRAINYTFPTVRVPDDVGYLTLPIAIFESDEERGGDRDRALAKFADGVGAEVASEREGFLRTLGRSIAADWKLARAEVFAFTRSETVTCGQVYSGTLDRWVRAKQRVTIPLTMTKQVRVNGLRAG